MTASPQQILACARMTNVVWILRVQFHLSLERRAQGGLVQGKVHCFARLDRPLAGPRLRSAQNDRGVRNGYNNKISQKNKPVKKRLAIQKKLAMIGGEQNKNKGEKRWKKKKH